MIRPLPLTLLLAIGGAGLAPAQEHPVFNVRRMSGWDERATQGRCTVRVRVDGEIDVELRGQQVLLRTLAGQPGNDEGSECSQPLPAGGYQSFSFRKTGGRGEARLVQEPRPGNDYRAIVAVRDDRGGADSYSFELSWEATGNAGGGILPSLPIASATPTFAGAREMLRGSGVLRAGSKEEPLRRVWLNLQSGGGAELTVYGNEAYTLRGTWRQAGDRLELDLGTGFGTFGVTAKGEVSIAGPKKVAISGQSGRFAAPFTMQFTAQ